jgi:LuxR family maltose regulon positive regulatory protein
VEQSPALLVTKLTIPQPRSPYVSRARLCAELDTGLERKLILVAAAAGFGKTTLLAEWIASRSSESWRLDQTQNSKLKTQNFQIAWLALDAADSDPVRFLSYLIAAIQTRLPHCGRELLAALQSPQPPAAEHVLHSLLNQLAAAQERLLLVLDDYHLIANQAVHAALAFLLDHLPPCMTLVLLTRTDPPLPLARLRARGELLELRADALRFSATDTATFLNQVMRLDLGPAEVAALDMRTEGWIAGLQLAAVAMQAQHDDRAAFVRGFTGSHRFVLDYLIEEVLARQPKPVRRFLLQTAALDRMCAELCDAVVGLEAGDWQLEEGVTSLKTPASGHPSPSQTMLEHLERANLFLIPLDQSRRWYRYHHLFADLLRSRLAAESSPMALAVLHERAARWHAQNGLPEAAVGYALAAGAFDYAAELIVGPASGVSQRGEVRTLLDWYAAFPPELVRRDPGLSLYFGLAFALNGRWDEAETLLRYVEQLELAARPAEALMLAYLVASYRHDAARLAALAAATAGAPADALTIMVRALVVSRAGDLRPACRLMAAAQESGERAGDMALALTALFHQCRFHCLLGDLHRAYELCQLALRRAAELGAAALPLATFAHVSLGRVLFEWNELDRAAEHIAQAIELAERSGFLTGTMSSGRMLTAEVSQARGDDAGARGAAQEALEYAGRFDPAPEAAWLKTYAARLWLLQGNLAAAGEWWRAAQRQELPPSIFYPNSIRHVTAARVLLAQRKPREAVAILTRLLAAAPDLLTVEALALLALARQAEGDGVHALLALEQALVAAEAENRVRALLDLGAPLAGLLGRFSAAEPAPERGVAFARRLLAALPAPDRPEQLVEPLGERELAVLRLIVAGYSNDEIAKTLTIAVSTVKWYVNSLYAKLHVKTRSQAIARAHELGLLAD